ncbi:MAG: hypothetical protein QOF01_4375 [Thermomicrobiales bacterium]|nr:hypothetical protein [Thermomicrobiales bacterium]
MGLVYGLLTPGPATQRVPGPECRGRGRTQAELNGVSETSGQGASLRRYERPREEPVKLLPPAPDEVIPYEGAEAAIAACGLSAGSCALLRGLLRVGCTRVFPGGGIGIEYGSLLKTAARPDYLAGHVAEAAAHLRERRVDLLLVPGMSGYPVGSMYSIVSGVPAVLLKKAKLQPDGAYPPGAFVIPSYTGEGDVVMSADEGAVQDIVDGIVAPQLAAQRDAVEVTLTIRAAGADDIIDKATMSQAVGESAVVVGGTAIEDFVRRHRAATGDDRPIVPKVEVVAWVTPLIKGYNRPQEHLRRHFGLTPFAGLNVTSVHLEPSAIGIEGVGIVGFAGD